MINELQADGSNAGGTLDLGSGFHAIASSLQSVSSRMITSKAVRGSW